jgi:hypothetical protein
MANPRRITGPLDGIGFRAATFLIDGSTITWSATDALGSAVAGRAVGLVAGTQNTVELVAAGQDILGRLDHVESDGACAVQFEGECKLPQGNGVTVVRGDKIVGALGAASARGFIGPGDGTSGATALAGRHTVLDVAVTTAISVMLGD